MGLFSIVVRVIAVWLRVLRLKVLRREFISVFVRNKEQSRDTPATLSVRTHSFCHAMVYRWELPIYSNHVVAGGEHITNDRRGEFGS